MKIHLKIPLANFYNKSSHPSTVEHIPAKLSINFILLLREGEEEYIADF